MVKGDLVSASPSHAGEMDVEACLIVVTLAAKLVDQIEPHLHNPPHLVLHGDTVPSGIHRQSRRRIAMQISANHRTDRQDE